MKLLSITFAVYPLPNLNNATSLLANCVPLIVIELAASFELHNKSISASLLTLIMLPLCRLIVPEVVEGVLNMIVIVVEIFFVDTVPVNFNWTDFSIPAGKFPVIFAVLVDATGAKVRPVGKSASTIDQVGLVISATLGPAAAFCDQVYVSLTVPAAV